MLAWRQLPFRHPVLAAGCAVLALLLGVWSWLLWPQWTTDPDLSHGLFTPLLFFWLVHEARTRGTPRWLQPGLGQRCAVVGALILSWGLCALGGLYAAALDWSHALVLFLFACGLAALIAATWWVAASASVRLVPWNWAAAVALLLWPASAPLPPGTYTRLTLTLQSGVTEAVLVCLHALGIAAVRDGHVIELARVTVGVEEACSGRSCKSRGRVL
jgi:hypothetical protein